MLWWLILMAPWGVRTMPEPAGGVWLRWEGEAVATVDGQPVKSPVLMPLGAHDVRVGDVAFSVPNLGLGPCEPVRIAVLGDGRADADGVGPSAYWPGILRETMATDPLLILNTGDLVKTGESRQEWDNYLRSLPPWPPVVATRGNHDKGSHFDRMHAGPGEVWAMRLGPLLIASVDTEAPLDRMPALVEKLDALLAAEAPWKLVFTHRPIYSRGPHGGDERKLNHLLVPVFERRQVAVVFSGHDHNYERFCPTLGLGAERRCDPAGVTYIVTGGAATFTMPFPGLTKNPTDAERDKAMSQYFSGSKHFIQVDVTGDTMTFTARRTLTGNVRPPGVMDTVTIRRGRCP